jgi:hypothetical protein
MGVRREGLPSEFSRQQDLKESCKEVSDKGVALGKRDVGPKSPLLEWAQYRAAVTGEGDRRAE